MAGSRCRGRVGSLGHQRRVPERKKGHGLAKNAETEGAPTTDLYLDAVWVLATKRDPAM